MFFRKLRPAKPAPLPRLRSCSFEKASVVQDFSSNRCCRFRALELANSQTEARDYHAPGVTLQALLGVWFDFEAAPWLSGC